MNLLHAYAFYNVLMPFPRNLTISFFYLLQVPVSYGVPTVATCTLVQWFKEIGFATLFGALLLKTWR